MHQEFLGLRDPASIGVSVSAARGRRCFAGALSGVERSFGMPLRGPAYSASLRAR